MDRRNGKPVVYVRYSMPDSGGLHRIFLDRYHYWSAGLDPLQRRSLTAAVRLQTPQRQACKQPSKPAHRRCQDSGAGRGYFDGAVVSLFASGLPPDLLSEPRSASERRVNSASMSARLSELDDFE